MKRVQNQRSSVKAVFQRFINEQDCLVKEITKKKHVFSDEQKWVLEFSIFCNDC